MWQFLGAFAYITQAASPLTTIGDHSGYRSMHRSSSAPDIFYQLSQISQEGEENEPTKEGNDREYEIAFGIGEMTLGNIAYHHRSGRQRIEACVLEYLTRNNFQMSLVDYFDMKASYFTFPYITSSSLETLFENLDFYDFDFLGKGSFSHVFYATSSKLRPFLGSKIEKLPSRLIQEGVEFAVKIQSCTTKEECERLLLEFEVHWKCGGISAYRHPNIAIFYGAYVF